MIENLIRTFKIQSKSKIHCLKSKNLLFLSEKMLQPYSSLTTTSPSEVQQTCVFMKVMN